jgi:predicted transcriptional regulator
LKRRTSITLDDGLWRRIKIRAVNEGRDASQIVAEALEDYLRRVKKGGKDR